LRGSFTLRRASRRSVVWHVVIPHGYASGIHPDPIEKKPFFHVFPGSLAMSFGMLGCDFHCGYCENWVTSQSLRDPLAGASPTEGTPEQYFGDVLSVSTHAEVSRLS